MDADTTNSVNAAIRNKDLVGLVRLLDLKPKMWGSCSRFFHETQRNETITLLRKLTTEGFGVGLQSRAI